MSHETTSGNMSSLNSTILVPYNVSIAKGGDLLTDNVNIFYNSGDVAWIIISTALVLLMIPGVGFFYSGLSRRKSALSLIWLSLMSSAIISFQWYLWGYSLTFSRTAGKYIGNLDNVVFRNVLAQPSVGSVKVPDLLFAIYQGMFAAITPALAIGAAAERGRILPCLVFMFVWSTLIYDPIACWIWNPKGWAFIMGGLDFAGGTSVHISSGAAALAYSLMLGKRHGYSDTHGLPYRPHHVAHIVIGTIFLWFGWFGFNGGSALGANMRAVMACVVTHLAASVGGITWALIDYYVQGKWSTVGFCSGVVAGLVAITPASGFVPPWSAIIFGIVGATVCNYATRLKYYLKVDDGLDIFSEHGVGGIVGNIMTAFFATDYIAHLDGFSEIPGGWLNHHWVQLGYQLASSVSSFGYSFLGTCLILFVMNLIPGLSLRVSEEAEIGGIDDAEMREFAYDYVETDRDVDNLRIPVTFNRKRSNSEKAKSSSKKVSVRSG